jgi:hypothetical protein
MKGALLHIDRIRLGIREYKLFSRTSAADFLLWTVAIRPVAHLANFILTSCYLGTRGSTTWLPFCETLLVYFLLYLNIAALFLIQTELQNF